MSISVSKWPMLPTIALCFICAIASTVITFLLPVVVTKRSAVSTTSSSGRDLVALHRRLQRADRVDLGDDDARALAAQRLRAALADVAVAADHRDLAREHHVGGAADAVDERVAAAVEVVELRLRDRVVDVDRREQQRAALHHLVEPVHAGGGLLGDAVDARRPCGASDGRRRRARRRAARGRPRTPRCRRSTGRAPRRRARTRRPCARAASRRRRRRGSCWGRCCPCRPPATTAPGRCTTSTPRASRPSTRTPGCPAAGDRGGRRGPGWRRCCSYAQRTSAPSSTSVSMSTAVWIVMCSEPVMRAPASGLVAAVALAAAP